jgi:hypothetical protein
VQTVRKDPYLCEQKEKLNIVENVNNL